jgi:hypothetical protein
MFMVAERDQRGDSGTQRVQQLSRPRRIPARLTYVPGYAHEIWLFWNGPEESFLGAVKPVSPSPNVKITQMQYG